MSSEVPESCNNTGLPVRWASHSENGGHYRYTHTLEAVALAQAVETALSHRRSAPEVRRAARAWGATLPDPSVVVSAVASLREAASESVGPTDSAGGEPTVTSRVLRIIDGVLSEAIEGVSASLREAALVDPLTGCANRRALEEDLQRAVAGASRTGLDVALAVIDLDGLKKINDSGGHAAGDACLCDLARALRSVLRDTDHVYRVGGDEFVVLMPYSGTEGAYSTMARARAEGAPAFSWGAASLSMLAPGAGVDQLLDLADASLYASRRASRRPAPNRTRRRRVVLAGAAAAAIAGFSSSVILQPTSNETILGAPAPNTAKHVSGGSTTTPPPTATTAPPAESVHHSHSSKDSRTPKAFSPSAGTGSGESTPVLAVSTTRTVEPTPSKTETPTTQAPPTSPPPTTPPPTSPPPTSPPTTPPPTSPPTTTPPTSPPTTQPPPTFPNPYPVQRQREHTTMDRDHIGCGENGGRTPERHQWVHDSRSAQWWRGRRL